MQYRLRRDVTYPTTRGHPDDPRGDRPRERHHARAPARRGSTAQALADSEVTLYAGHARRGIGPDFDADTSPAENFVIGVASALHASGRAIEPSQV